MLAAVIEEPVLVTVRRVPAPRAGLARAGSRPPTVVLGVRR